MTQKTTRFSSIIGWKRAKTVERESSFPAGANITRDSLSSASMETRAINVIIPVYRGIDETARCFDSVIAAGLPENSFITVVDDASPEPGMATLLEKFSRGPSITVLQNESNRGFVGSVNRGMAFRPNADVVLLNSDTEVPPGWLQRIQQCAYAASNIGTATPFSNNATICSYPRFCSDNIIPEGYSIDALDNLFREANVGDIVDLPTAVGFCMYIRRDCLDEIGLFDEERFGRGYGEENDFCLRATAKGWRHVLAPNLFVYHAGSVSFAGERDERSKNAMRLIVERNPEYPRLVRKHIEQDPARELRQRVDLLRLAQSGKPLILSVSHHLGGGVEKHERGLSTLFREQAEFLHLGAATNQQLEISWFRESESLRLHFALPQDAEALVAFLRSIPLQRIHFHHLLNIPDIVVSLPAVLGIPYDFTAHDYYSICPRITLTSVSHAYCGEPSEEGCHACLRSAPKHQRDIRAWRGKHGMLLAGAERVFAPSGDVVQRLNRYFHLQNVTYAPHPDVAQTSIPVANARRLAAGKSIRIAILGALSAIKGANILEAAALDAKNRDLPIEFHLIGYGFRKLATVPASRLTVSGPYRDEDLPRLLDEARPDLIWFPALVPETYSYTLSAALVSGLPIIATDLGAFPERLANRAWSWIFSWTRPAEEWNDLFIDLMQKNFIKNVAPPMTAAPYRGHFFEWKQCYLKIDNSGRERDKGEVKVTHYADRYSRPRFSLAQRTMMAVRGSLLPIALRIRSAPLASHLIDIIPLSWRLCIRGWLRS